MIMCTIFANYAQIIVYEYFAKSLKVVWNDTRQVYVNILLTMAVSVSFPR